MKSKRTWVVFLWVISACLIAETRSAQESRRPGNVVLERVSVTTEQQGTVEFDLGTILVPENRSEPSSRLIGVGFARFPAVQATGAPPVFFLPGGPGGSYLTDLKQGNIRLPNLLRMIGRHRAVADVVLMDQRGYSQRGEMLKFEYAMPAEPKDEPGSLARAVERYVALARAAVADSESRGIDLRGYTVLECADDVNDVRKYLGYDKIALAGGSFGSQWSFAILRRHPETVARAVLAGVEPLDCGYDMPSHVLAALQRMWSDAERDAGLKPYLPDGGLMAAARAVVRRLEMAPVRVELNGVKDAETGEPVTVTLGVEDFQRDALLRSSDGPAFLLSLYHEQYNTWAFSVAMARRGRTAGVPLIAPSIDSSLGATPRRLFLLRTDPAGEFLGHWNFEQYLASADIWPSPDVGDEFRTEVVCQIPVVFVQGDWDTQTPVENLLQVVPYFPNSRTLIVERGGHGAMNQLAQHFPDTLDALFNFLKTGETTNLPARVTLPVPKFSPPSFPPPAQ